MVHNCCMALVVLEATRTVPEVIWPIFDLFSTPLTRTSVEADLQTDAEVEKEKCTVVQIPILPPTFREVLSHVGVAASWIVLKVRNQVLRIFTPSTSLWLVWQGNVRLNGLLRV